MLAKVIYTRKVISSIFAAKTDHKREWVALLATGFSLLNKAISLAAVFFYVRWTIPYLGQERFGAWMTMSTIIMFIAVFSDFGLGSSLVNYIAATKATKDQQQLKAYTSSTFYFLTLMALFSGGVIYLSNNSLTAVISNGIQQAGYIEEVRKSLLLLFLFFLVGLPFITVDKTLEGLQLTYVSSVWMSVGNLISLMTTFVFTQYSLGLCWLVASTLGVQSLFRIGYFFVEFQGRLRPYKPSLTSAKLTTLTRLLRYGLLFFVLNLFNVLAFQFDNVIISRELGVKDVPLFSLMQKLLTISLFFWFYTISLWPAFAEAHSIRDMTWIKKTVAFVALLNISLGILFGLAVILFAPQILSFWSKGTVAAPSLTMTLGFALYVVLNGLLATAGMVFNTGPLLKKHAVEYCSAALVTIVLKVMLVKQLGVDYIMYLSILPFVLLYMIPVYIKYKKYVRA